ncbi:MAG: SLC13 family permease [Nitrososphaeria archaeon]|nr:SLC13 family permease [Nitrososphaeria archaeon]
MLSTLNQFIALFLLLYLIIGLILRSKRAKIPIWALMASAAFITVLTGLVPSDEIANSIDWQVIMFLIGMFSIVALADSSGLLNYISLKWVSIFKSRLTLTIASSILFGLLAAFTVNDTVALMGPPLAFYFARAAGLPLPFMFILLAFSLTIGSVTTPMGNPQNVLIAIGAGMDAPLITFLEYLAIPTLINLVVTPLLLFKLFNIKNTKVETGFIPGEQIKNFRDAILGGIGIILVVCILLTNDILSIYGLPHIREYGFIPFVIASILYLLSSNPREILKHIDWGTILFFITMFITMEGIWRTSLVKELISLVPVIGSGILGKLVNITLASILFSQILSNVPFAKFYVEYLKATSISTPTQIEWITLAMASTIAGNLTILGAASNIIIVEYLEGHYGTTISFKEFFKYGLIITTLNTIIYMIYIIFTL